MGQPDLLDINHIYDLLLQYQEYYVIFWTGVTKAVVCVILSVGCCI